MKTFGLIGAGGYIAPRHMKAISATGNDLLVAMDITDSVGILDSHFPAADFFTEFEEFSAHVEDLKHKKKKLDFISICSPNYLHLPHIKFSLKNGIDVICEKPLVLAVEDLTVIKDYEKRFGARVYSILQLRLHPSIVALRDMVQRSEPDKKFDVKLTYLTSRGKWYLKSWKGVDKKSGGVATNIGVHFYDMLHYIFGAVLKNEVHYRDDKTSSGFLEYQKARVTWFLSIDASHLPVDALKSGQSTHRSIEIEGDEVEFSDGFTDLHTKSYENILAGNGFGVDENYVAIETVAKMRCSALTENPQMGHPLLSALKK